MNMAGENKARTSRAPRLDYAHVALASLPFMGMISFWQVFDGIVPKMLTGTFGLDNMTTGAVMAIDNVFGLVLLPLFGILSDRCASRLGRRTPFILIGSVIAAFSVPLIAVANGMRSLPLLIFAILLTLFAICMYRTMTVAIVCDITPRPLRTKADSIQKMVGYAGTGAMLVAIAVMVPSGDMPNYIPLFMLQALVILGSAVVYAIRVREPQLVTKMHDESLKMGIEESEIMVDDSPEAGGRAKITDRSVLFSIAMLLAATFFYYMSYNAMTTNISRYADMFYNMEGGSYAIINIVTIVGALSGYVPLANLSLKVGRKRVAVASALVMALAPVALWLIPGFSPVFYLVFLAIGIALGGVDMCVYTMLLEVVDANSVGRYSGYYYTVSMAAQVATPILSGIVMDVAPGLLFAYIALMGIFMLFAIAAARHGDTVLIDEVARRESARRKRRSASCGRTALRPPLVVPTFWHTVRMRDHDHERRRPYEHPDLRHQEELRHQEGAALLQRAAHQVPVHRLAREGDEQGRAPERDARGRRHRRRDRPGRQGPGHRRVDHLPGGEPEVRQAPREPAGPSRAHRAQRRQGDRGVLPRGLEDLGVGDGGHGRAAWKDLHAGGSGAA